MSVERRKKVCVVGAGASGLPAIRNALLYGFKVVCYENQNDIGGLWRYKSDETDEASVMKSTVINTSKELTAYSDFPPPPEEANFMHNTHMYAYLKSYADKFELHKYIHLNTKVMNVERTADYAKTGKWNVTIKDNSSGATSTEEFDGVLMCTGHHTLPHWPNPWPAQASFRGDIIHAHSYKDHRGYEDKTVVVVGVGNSGGDVAVELSRIAKQVYLVSRRGTWVFNRIFRYGRPLDCALNTKLFEGLRRNLPASVTDQFARWQLNNRFDHKAYSLKPAHPVFSAHPTVNDELPNRIACGTIRVKPGIESFTSNGVHFTDGTTVDDVDSVIVCTGYSFEFPIIENGSLIKVDENDVDLYKYIFPNDCDHDTLGVIGLIQPYGSIMPISEMQSRVVLDVLAGRTTLPSKEQRRADVRAKREEMGKRYVKSRRHTIQVDYIPYMEELADFIGCNPPSWHELILSDPSLALHMLLAPMASYFFRLKGPHPWAGAREAILGIDDRVAKATNHALSSSVYSLKNDGFVIICIIVLLALLSLAFLLSLIF